MDYLSWNDLIASHFFRPEMAGRTVHLYVTEELIGSLGQASGADLQDFIKAVKTGSVGVIRQGICQKALGSMEHWKYRSGRRGYPLYIGYLALFVLAAGIEGDFSPNEYYRRLRTLLGEETKSGQYPLFNQMRELWDDLEQWTNEYKSGELGIFNINIAGSWIHVGIPIAQTLLTEQELKALPDIFAAGDLDPTSPPSEGAIAFLLAKHGHRHLRKRTLRLLEKTSDHDELRQALIERIVDQLHNWDGTADLPFEDGTQVYGLLRLCCQLDQTAGRAIMTMRCSTRHEFPEDGLFLLKNNNNSDSFLCDEYGNGWSSPIRSESDGKNIVASKLDWCQGLRMQSPDSRWCFKLPASPIRVFIKGDVQGLPGLIEVRQLPKGAPFFLAAHEKCCELLERWGTSCCQGFEKLPIVDGLPSRWYFFKAAAAHSDEIVKREYPILSLPTTVRLDLKGGIRIDTGNRFFKFAPPKLILQGGDESVKVYCNDTPLNCTKVEGIYELPTDIPNETKLVIEARIGEDVIRRRSLSLVEDFPWLDQIYKQQFDCFGYRQTNVDSNSMGVAGALVRGFNSPPFNFNTFLPVQGKQRIFFVGKEPGQVAIWPLESLPTDWLPVWAISIGRRGQAMFCGTSLVESEPTQSKCRDRKKLREWKEILWHRRKRISPPTQQNLRALWKKFQKEAERVKG